MASEGDDDDDVFSAYAWETKPWGSCSAACGPGVRARQVTCVHPCSLIYGCPEVAAELCLDSKPAEEEACQLAVCTTTVATTRTYVTSSSSTVTTRTSTTVTNTLEGNWQCIPLPTPGWGACLDEGACGAPGLCPCPAACPCCRPELASTSADPSDVTSGAAWGTGSTGDSAELWDGWYTLALSASLALFLCVLACCAYALLLPAWLRPSAAGKRAPLPPRGKVRQVPEAWAEAESAPPRDGGPPPREAEGDGRPPPREEARRRPRPGPDGFEQPPQVDLDPPGVPRPDAPRAEPAAAEGAAGAAGAARAGTPPRAARAAPAGAAGRGPAPELFGKARAGAAGGSPERGPGAGSKAARAAAERAFASSDVFGGTAAGQPAAGRRRQAAARGEAAAGEAPPRGEAPPPRPERPRPRSAEGSARGAGGSARGARAAGGEGGAAEPETAAELKALVDAELARTRGKDLEWRKRNLRQLLLRWHPDKNQDNQETAAEVTKHLLAQRAKYMEA